MRRFLGATSGIAIAGLVLVACSSSKSSSTTTTTAARAKADVVVTGTNPGPQQLKVGQTMDVEVSAPTGTNYSWSVKSGYNTGVVAQEGTPSAVPTKPGMPGAPAVTTFRFKAVGAGSTTVVIENKDNSSGAVGTTVSVPVTVTA